MLNPFLILQYSLIKIRLLRGSANHCVECVMNGMNVALLMFSSGVLSVDKDRIHANGFI